jgi:hypothetical protein
MRARTKVDIPNRSESEFENFDRAVKILLTKKKAKPAKAAKAKRKT